MALLKKILVIDDNEDNWIIPEDLIQHILSGYSYLSAPGGENGLALAASKGPDVILLGELIPGMDDFEVCRKIKLDSRTQLIPEVPFTLLTGDRQERIRAMGAVADLFLSRPIDETVLFVKILPMQKIKSATSQLQL